MNAESKEIDRRMLLSSLDGNLHPEILRLAPLLLSANEAERGAATHALVDEVLPDSPEMIPLFIPWLILLLGLQPIRLILGGAKLLIIIRNRIKPPQEEDGQLFYIQSETTRKAIKQALNAGLVSYRSLLHHSDPKVRGFGVDLLATSEQINEVRILKTQLDTEPDSTVTTRLLRALFLLVPRESVAYAAPYLRHKDLLIRFQAVAMTCLGSQPPPPAVFAELVSVPISYWENDPLRLNALIVIKQLGEAALTAAAEAWAAKLADPPAPLDYYVHFLVNAVFPNRGAFPEPLPSEQLSPSQRIVLAAILNVPELWEENEGRQRPNIFDSLYDHAIPNTPEALSGYLSEN